MSAAVRGHRELRSIPTRRGIALRRSSWGIEEHWVAHAVTAEGGPIIGIVASGVSIRAALVSSAALLVLRFRCSRGLAARARVSGNLSEPPYDQIGQSSARSQSEAAPQQA